MFIVRIYGYDAASEREALLEEHEFTSEGEARQFETELVREGAGLVTCTSGEWCDECGNLIPDSQPSMFNADHQPSCSLYPDRAPA